MSSALHRDLKVCELINTESELNDFLEGNWNYQVSRFDLHAYSFFLKHGGHLFSYLQNTANSKQSQDPIYEYGGRKIGASRLISGLKRIEGYFTKSNRRIHAIKCRLDHSPYIHDHIAG